jgi:hypothetical protein
LDRTFHILRDDCAPHKVCEAPDFPIILTDALLECSLRILDRPYDVTYARLPLGDPVLEVPLLRVQGLMFRVALGSHSET